MRTRGYIRFVGQNNDPDSHCREGIFVLAYDFVERVDTPDYDAELMQDLIGWFKKHMNIPDRFSKSKNPKSTNISVSWFKSDAKEHIAKAREIVLILERNNMFVESITTDNVGYIVYEDDVQVSAIPVKETFI